MEKVFKGWSFSSVIRTNFLSYSCFFLLLIEVELLLEGEGVEGVEVGGSGNKEGREDGREDEEGRSFFSLSA